MRRSIFCQAFLLMLLAMLPMQGMAQRISRSYANRSIVGSAQGPWQG